MSRRGINVSGEGYIYLKHQAYFQIEAYIREWLGITSEVRNKIMIHGLAWQRPRALIPLELGPTMCQWQTRESMPTMI